MEVKRIFLIFFTLLLILPAFSQNGIIKGKLTDGITNEPVAFANVVISGSSKGAVSDVDGNYEITGLEPGLYDVLATYIGFNELTIYEIQVTNSKPAIVNFELEASVEEIEEVVVKASPFRKTEEFFPFFIKNHPQTSRIVKVFLVEP